MPVTYNYMLTGRGLGSEINNLLFALHYAETQREAGRGPQDARFVLNSRHWNATVNKGWLDYFEPNPLFKTTSDSFSGKTLDLMIEMADSRGVDLEQLLFNWANPPGKKQRLLKALMKTISGNNVLLFFPLFHLARNEARNRLAGKPGEFKSAINKILLDIWKLNPEIKDLLEDRQIGKEYICVHIRRGDKITSGEDIEYSIIDYVKAIEDLGKRSEIVLVLCDDYRSFEQLASALPDHRLLTNTPKTARGHDQSDFNEKSKQEIRQATTDLIVDIELARTSTAFIGSHHSNVYRLVEYFKLRDCYSVAPNFRDLV